MRRPLPVKPKPPASLALLSVSLSLVHSLYSPSLSLSATVSSTPSISTSYSLALSCCLCLTAGRGCSEYSSQTSPALSPRGTGWSAGVCVLLRLSMCLCVCSVLLCVSDSTNYCLRCLRDGRDGVEKDRHLSPRHKFSCSHLSLFLSGQK